MFYEFQKSSINNLSEAWFSIFSTSIPIQIDIRDSNHSFKNVLASRIFSFVIGRVVGWWSIFWTQTFWRNDYFIVPFKIDFRLTTKRKFFFLLNWKFLIWVTMNNLILIALLSLQRRYCLERKESWRGGRIRSWRIGRRVHLLVSLPIYLYTASATRLRGP